jgi:DNA-binding response OmpR family regulator
MARFRREAQVLASLNHPNIATVVKGLEGGADAYLSEPVDPEVLVATVKALLRARRGEEAVRSRARLADRL